MKSLAFALAVLNGLAGLAGLLGVASCLRRGPDEIIQMPDPSGDAGADVLKSD